MNEKWLTVAIVLVVVGVVLFCGVMTALHWDFTKLSIDRYEENRYDLQEEYEHIAVLTGEADVEFRFTDRADTAVICYEKQTQKHRVFVENGTLTVRLQDAKKWYHYIGISFGMPRVTVELPRKDYGNISVQTNTGKIAMEQFTALQVELAVSTGKVTVQDLNCAGDFSVRVSTGNVLLTNVRCANFVSEGNTGDAEMNNMAVVGNCSVTRSTGKLAVTGMDCTGDLGVRVSTGKIDLENIRCADFTSQGSTGDLQLTDLVASGTVFIRRSTGDVRLDRCDGRQIQILTSTGDVSGSLLTEKIFVTDTDTGNVNVPACLTGGKCEVTTDTGDIEITVKEQ